MARNITQIVEYILSNNRQTRNSDKELLIAYFRYIGLGLTPKQETIFRGAASAETIRRIRQKFQESGKYPADQAISQYRESKSQETQQRMPTTKPEQIAQLFDDSDYRKEYF